MGNSRESFCCLIVFFVSRMNKPTFRNIGNWNGVLWYGSRQAINDPEKMSALKWTKTKKILFIEIVSKA